MRNVIVTNGKRDNVRTTTPLRDRQIDKALEGRKTPSKEEVIKKLKKEKRYAEKISRSKGNKKL